MAYAKRFSFIFTVGLGVCLAVSALADRTDVILTSSARVDALCVWRDSESRAIQAEAHGRATSDGGTATISTPVRWLLTGQDATNAAALLDGAATRWKQQERL